MAKSRRSKNILDSDSFSILSRKSSKSGRRSKRSRRSDYSNLLSYRNRSL